MHWTSQCCLPLILPRRLLLILQRSVPPLIYRCVAGLFHFQRQASTRWGLVATSGAHHLWHIDCNSFCTYIDTQNGMKWWIVAKPKPGSMHFSNAMLFTEEYDISAANLEKWDLEAVLLCPGSRMLMQPNTLHFVVTPESAICHGGHFYAMSTIQDTVFGLYHMFVASERVTNMEHSHDAHLLLQRMVTYLHYVLIKRGSKLDLSMPLPTCHIPDVSTFEGVLDLFMLCVVMELGDLINPLAYRKKY
ncbi:hypothetical protein L208DRAFT_1298262 [Tricholoma matsutake]|nr:hypothetical protein L208DRAFT_1298262 [Tricholoma matsutake 945]